MDKIPDPEVPERPTRRRFSGAYKMAILNEIDQATEPGAKGPIMRREGLYSSSITEWRKLRAEGGLDGLARARGPRAADPLALILSLIAIVVIAVLLFMGGNIKTILSTIGKAL